MSGADWSAAVDVTMLEDADDAGIGGGAAAEPQLVFANVADFFHEHLRHNYARQVGPGSGQLRWSASWWECSEALSRLEAVWRAWEHLRLDGALGMSSWWREHADYHMGVLLAPDGPFRASKDENERGEPLPSTPPPPGLFPTRAG